MTEIIFLVEELPEGGYTARAASASIFTQADDISALREALREALRDAVRCHFADDGRPSVIRLQF